MQTSLKDFLDFLHRYDPNVKVAETGETSIVIERSKQHQRAFHTNSTKIHFQSKSILGRRSCTYVSARFRGMFETVN